MDLIVHAPLPVKLLGALGLLLLASGAWDIVSRSLAGPRLVRSLGQVVRYEQAGGRARLGLWRWRLWRPVVEYRVETDDVPRYLTASFWAARQPFDQGSQVPVVYDPLEAVGPALDHPRAFWPGPLAAGLAGVTLLALVAAWLHGTRG